MVYFITALTNDKARLIVSQTQTTDIEIYQMVVQNLEKRGFIVSVKTES